MSTGRMLEEKIKNLIKDYEALWDEKKSKKSIQSLLELALADNQESSRINPPISIQAIQAVENYNKKDYDSGRERDSMLLIAAGLKDDKQQKEENLKLAVDCYHKSYDMSVQYEQFLKGKHFGNRTHTEQGRYRETLHADDYGNAVYWEKLFFNHERSKAVEGLIHLAQNDSLTVKEHALKTLSDIYIYQSRETSPGFEDALDYAAILGKTGISQDEQELIAARLDKAIQEHKEPEKIKQGIYKLGELYEKLGNSEKALEKYKQAAELNDINANEKLAQIYEKGHLGQHADMSKAAQYYFQIGNIYFSQGESKRQEYLKEKNYVESYQNKDKIKKLEKELESTEGRWELLANDYFKKAFILEPKVIEEYLSILENQKKMTQLDAIKNVLQSLSSEELASLPEIKQEFKNGYKNEENKNNNTQEVKASVGSAAVKQVGELVQEIDNKMIVLQVNKVCSGLHRAADSIDPEWMTKLLTLENEVKKRNITDPKILGSIHSSLTKAFSLWEGKEEKKRQEDKYMIDSSLDKSRTKWDQYFHSMLNTRYSPPHNVATPIVDGIIKMLEQKNDFSAKLALYDFYIAELKFVKKLDPQSDKIDMLNKKLVDLADEVLRRIPKLDKKEKKQLQNKGYDTTKLRQECLQTLKNVSVEIGSGSTRKANKILMREQSLLSKGFFQIKKMLSRSHPSQIEGIELTKVPDSKKRRGK